MQKQTTKFNESQCRIWERKAMKIKKPESVHLESLYVGNLRHHSFSLNPGFVSSKNRVFCCWLNHPRSVGVKLDGNAMPQSISLVKISKSGRTSPNVSFSKQHLSFGAFRFVIGLYPQSSSMLFSDFP